MRSFRGFLSDRSERRQDLSRPPTHFCRCPLLEKANQQTQFRYRLDVDGEFFSFVPTATRDANGFVVAATPLLDRRVTIPMGNRRVFESAKLMAESLSAQTGLRVSCCQGMVAGIPWGKSSVPLEAHNETARNVLERLLRLESSPPQDYWLLRCDSAWCFINVQGVWGAQCRQIHSQASWNTARASFLAVVVGRFERIPTCRFPEWPVESNFWPGRFEMRHESNQ